MGKIIAIAGKQRAGKTTVANMIKKHTGWVYFNTSDILQAKLIKELGIDKAEIEANKHLYRDKLIQLGQGIETQEPCGLIKSILRDVERLLSGAPLILESIRRSKEVSLLKPLVSAPILLIDAEREIRAKRGKLACEDDTTEVEGYDALLREGNYHLIENTGTLAELESKVLEYLRRYKIK